MNVVEEIATKSATLPFEAQREILTFVDFVASRSLANSADKQNDSLDDSSASLRWLDENRAEYLGEWIALDGNRLIAHGDNAKKVYAAARAAGVRVPFVELVTEIEKAPFCGGWE